MEVLIKQKPNLDGQSIGSIHCEYRTEILHQAKWAARTSLHFLPFPVKLQTSAGDIGWLAIKSKRQVERTYCNVLIYKLELYPVYCLEDFFLMRELPATSLGWSYNEEWERP